MAGVAVGVSVVIKCDIHPIGGADMAVTALTRPMSIRAVVAGCTTVFNARMVKGNITPIGDIMAVGTLP